jgi:hypothetical protein
MSHRSTTSTRFLLLALWLCCTASAFAQDAAPKITLQLAPAEFAQIWRLIDLNAAADIRSGDLTKNPPAVIDLQISLERALQANPEASRAVLSLRSAAR